MCVLTYLPPNTLPSVERLTEGACNNPDGFGFAVIVGDRIETGHGMDASATIDAFVKVRRAHPESHALFHSRITTDGLTNVDNCHPFIVNGDDRTVLAHNGILHAPARPEDSDVRSDTRLFADDMGSMLYPGRLVEGKFRGGYFNLNSKRGRRRLREWLTNGNKMLILSVDPRFKRNAYLINENQGVWEDDGCWYSNTSYSAPRYRYTSYNWDDWGDDAAIAKKLVAKSRKHSDDSLECVACNARNQVEPLLNYCHACGTCQDCFGDAYTYGQSWSCECAWPGGTRPTADKRESTGTGWIYDAVSDTYAAAPQELTDAPVNLGPAHSTGCLTGGVAAWRDCPRCSADLGPAHSTGCLMDGRPTLSPDCPRCWPTREESATLRLPSADS